MHDNEPKVKIAFNQSTTGKGEGYSVTVTEDARVSDVVQAYRMAGLARAAVLETLDGANANIEINAMQVIADRLSEYPDAKD